MIIRLPEVSSIELHNQHTTHLLAEVEDCLPELHLLLGEPVNPVIHGVVGQAALLQAR